MIYVSYGTGLPTFIHVGLPTFQQHLPQHRLIHHSDVGVRYLAMSHTQRLPEANSDATARKRPASPNCRFHHPPKLVWKKTWPEGGFRPCAMPRPRNSHASRVSADSVCHLLTLLARDSERATMGSGPLRAGTLDLDDCARSADRAARSDSGSGASGNSPAPLGGEEICSSFVPDTARLGQGPDGRQAAGGDSVHPQGLRYGKRG